MIFDTLTTLADGLVDALDEAAIDRAIVVAPRARGTTYEQLNDAVARAADDRLVGFARLDPLTAGAAAELDRCLALGLRGLFLHPWEDCFPIDDQAVDALVRPGVPVIVATGYPWVSEALQLGELAGRHPETTFVATNGAQINISGLGQADAELALAENPNLLIQTSGVYREDFIEGVVERFGAERVMFASAWPRFDPRLELRRVEWAPGLSERDRAAILSGNASRLLGVG